MRVFRIILNSVVTAYFLSGAIAAAAQPVDRLPELLDRLSDPETGNWELVEQEILQRWSISGSATADMLVSLGTRAMDAGELEVAITHLTALVDHAPEFAEGWNLRATAYFRAGLFGPALYDLQQALALNPQHFGAMIGLGVMLEEMERPEAALRAFRASQAIHPHRPDVEGAIARIEQSLQGAAL